MKILLSYSNKNIIPLFIYLEMVLSSFLIIILVSFKTKFLFDVNLNR